MNDYLQYLKKLKDFDLPFTKENKELKPLGYYPEDAPAYKKDFPQAAEEKKYIERDPNFITLDNIPSYSESTVNTKRISTHEKGMKHKEGGWPLGVDPTERQDLKKFIKKKFERTTDNIDKFTPAVQKLVKSCEDVIRNNNIIDMYQEYFYGEEPEHVVESLSTKTLMLFKDKSEIKRSVSRISWHPESSERLAVSYAIMRFQSQPEGMPKHSYIWDINNPNSPRDEIQPSSPIVSIGYNPKNTEQIAYGCYNGVVGVWDVRAGKQAWNSLIEDSHSEPVTDLMWLGAKLGTDFVSTSTDGKVYWWDIRETSGKPVDTLTVTENADPNDTGVGCSKIEYNPEYGPKYLLGTEKGTILLANKKQKPVKKVEINFAQSYGIDSGRHLGPVYALQRNFQNPKYFLSVGDWSVKIWDDDLKTPIIRTRYHSSYLTDGCWSPSRSGVFFVTRTDGWLDVWDYYYRQNEIAFSHKVSDSALTCIKLNHIYASSMQGMQHANIGRYAAIGDQNGTVILLELCKALWETQPKEKDEIAFMFDREKKKEELLKSQRSVREAKKIANAKLEQQASLQKKSMEDQENKKAEQLKKLVEEFHADIQKQEQKIVISDDSDVEGGGQRHERPPPVHKQSEPENSPVKSPPAETRERSKPQTPSEKKSEPQSNTSMVQPDQKPSSNVSNENGKTKPDHEPEIHHDGPKESGIKSESEIKQNTSAEQLKSAEIITDSKVEEAISKIADRKINWIGSIKAGEETHEIKITHLELLPDKTIHGSGNDSYGDYNIKGIYNEKNEIKFEKIYASGDENLEFNGKLAAEGIIGEWHKKSAVEHKGEFQLKMSGSNCTQTIQLPGKNGPKKISLHIQGGHVYSSRVGKKGSIIINRGALNENGEFIMSRNKIETGVPLVNYYKGKKTNNKIEGMFHKSNKEYAFELEIEG